MCNSAINYEAGHEYIDLGLSVKWSSCNIGAESPDGYGYRFICGDNKTHGFDTANIIWHWKWRMPTVKDFEELLDNCLWQWEEHDEIRGIRFTSTKPGFESNSIFLRASGLFDIDDDGLYEYGMYRTANLSTNEASQSQHAQILTFDKGLSGKGELLFISDSYYPWACVRPVFS